jgi:hypothetical protein
MHPVGLVSILLICALRNVDGLFGILIFRCPILVLLGFLPFFRFSNLLSASLSSLCVVEEIAPSNGPSPFDLQLLSAQDVLLDPFPVSIIHLLPPILSL